MRIIDTFIKDLQYSWQNIMPIIKEEALITLTTNLIEIDFSQGQIKNISNEEGVYLFWIYPLAGFDFSNFKSGWKSDESPVYSPNISRSRIHFDLYEKWYPLYIGKAEKLSNRLNEHCFQDILKKTHGLKLMHRKDLLLNSRFSFSYYKITDDRTLDKNVIQFVMINLEKEIRDKLKPWIGKQ